MTKNDNSDKVTPKLNAKTAIKLEVGTSDLVAIRVAQVETDLAGRRKEQEGIQRTLNTERKRFERDREDLVVVLVSTELPEVKIACNAMETLGLKGPKTEHVLDAPGKKVTVTISAANGERYGNSASSTKTLQMTVAIQELCDKLTENADRAAEVQQELVQIRKELGSLGTVERQAKAAIATQVLQDMEGGTELIEAAQGGDIGVGNGQKLLSNDAS